jgi:hypothetical protein
MFCGEDVARVVGGKLLAFVKKQHPDLKSKVITPDVLVQPHNASLEIPAGESVSKASDRLGRLGGVTLGNAQAVGTVNNDL